MILADVPNATLSVYATSITNHGTLRAQGGRLEISGLAGGTMGGTLELVGSFSQVSLNGSGYGLPASGVVVGAQQTLTLDGAWRNAGILSVNGGTLNLNGTFTQADVGVFNRAGGTVNLNGTLTGGLALDATTGSWLLAGTINGGIVSTREGAQLEANGGTLSGVTLASAVNIPNGSYLRIADGLKLVNGATISLNSGGQQTTLYLTSGPQTIEGNGAIVGAGSGANQIYLGLGGPTSLELGSGVTVRGRALVAQVSAASPSSVLNHGILQADAAPGIQVQVTSLTNRGSLRAMNGAALRIFPRLAPTSTGGLLARDGSVLYFGGSAILDGTNSMVSQPAGTIQLGGNLLGNIQNPLLFMPQGITLLDGSGRAVAPQLLEVMSPDVGTNAVALTGPFAFGKLVLGNDTYVRLVDQSDNSPGPEAEALYVSSVIVPRGCTLDLNGLAVYTRAAQVNGVVTNGTLQQIPDSGPLNSGTPTAASLALSRELDEWTFFGRAGQRFTIVVDTGSTSVLTPRLNYAEVRLLAPDGGLLACGSNTVAGQTVQLSATQLPMDGTYRIEVRAPIQQPAAAGNYLIALWEVIPDVAPLVLNQTMNGRIETPFSVDRWTFSAMAGQQVRFDLINASASGVNFTLIGPSGWVGFSNLVNDSGLVNLPTDGSYTLTASSSNGAYDVAYAFQLLETTQTPLALGQSFSGQFTGSGQAQMFIVTVTNSGPVRVSLLGVPAGNRAELYAARNSLPTRASFAVSAADGSGPNRDLLVPNASPGTLNVLVYGDYVPSPGPFTLQVTSAGVYLTGITPTRSANNTAFDLTVSGAGFESGTTIELLADGGVLAGGATNISVDSFSQLTASFPPGVAPPGVYSVRLQQPDGDTAILTNAFELLDPGEPRLVTRLIMPGSLGRNTMATIYVEYANEGTASMPAPLLALRSADPDGSDRPILTLDESRLVQNFWAGGLPPG
ncbi:MAG TPA: hypothetical protein VNO52_15555, partial [Methylomirabilota bacterium]|nr:hypothetical protein [Methylomirabilota bacterium]